MGLLYLVLDLIHPIQFVNIRDKRSMFTSVKSTISLLSILGIVGRINSLKRNSLNFIILFYMFLQRLEHF